MTEAAQAQRLESNERVVAILDVTADILGKAGYDGLQLRDVARQARVSLSTIYDYFPSRDELIISAVDRWMIEHVYEEMPVTEPDEPLRDVLVRLFRALFEPWRRNPTMLMVMVRASMAPGGQRLWFEGNRAISRAEYFAGYDSEFVNDVGRLLNYLALGLFSAFASGRIDADEMLVVFEQAADRLTGGVEPQRATTGSSRRRQVD